MGIPRFDLIFFIVFFASASISAPSNAFEKQVHIIFRSFIKPGASSNPNEMTKTSADTYVIRAPEIAPLLAAYPSLTGTCFSTDDRDFSKQPTASARTTVEFVIEISSRKINVAPPNGRAMMRTGVTRNVDCKTGQDKQPPRKASIDNFSIGDVRNDGFVSTFFVKAAAFDPFYDLPPPLRAPDVDFSFSVRYDALRRELEIKGSTDNFPAFEGYYSIDGSEWEPILKRDPPKGATALSLIDANLGINTTNFSKEISLK
ncbi:MAG: DUF3238 domain-containing protein [Pseudomonadota bacterium]